MNRQAVVDLVLRLSFQHLSVKDQMIALRLSHSSRELILEDINLLWKQRLEQKLGRALSNARIDWQQAYKVSSEGSRYLGLLLSDFTSVANDASLRYDATKEDHHRALRLALSLLPTEITLKETKSLLSLAVSSGSIQCLPDLLRCAQLPSGDFDALIITAACHKKESMIRLLLLHPGVEIASKTITFAMAQAIINNRTKAFNILLHDSRAVFCDYHSAAMCAAVCVESDHFVKTLLNDSKAGDRKRDYSDAIDATKRRGKERLAALIATHPKVKLDRKSVGALRNLYGTDKANKWLKR